MLRSFKNFLLRGDIVTIAIGLIIALAFSTLIAAFTTNVITPLINRAEGSHPVALGVQLGKAGNVSTFMNFGAFVSAIVYFLIFMLVVYFLIVLPFKAFQARRGVVVFGDPPPAKTCPACLSADLPAAATKCKYCGTEQPAVA
jgi:large conductance mechanosensitive channel